MLLDDYITMLQAKRLEHGNIEVCITQNGYYADGQFADLYDEAEWQRINLAGGWKFVGGKDTKQPDDYRPFLVLGNSSQNY